MLGRGAACCAPACHGVSPAIALPPRAETFPLLTEGSGAILRSVTETSDEQTLRSRPRHTGPAAAENPRAPASQRLRHQPPPEASLRRHPAGQRRLALSRIAQARTR